MTTDCTNIDSTIIQATIEATNFDSTIYDSKIYINLISYSPNIYMMNNLINNDDVYFSIMINEDILFYYIIIDYTTNISTFYDIDKIEILLTDLSSNQINIQVSNFDCIREDIEQLNIKKLIYKAPKPNKLNIKHIDNVNIYLSEL